MSLVPFSTSQLGKGGSGISDGTLAKVLTELQGLTVSLVAGEADGVAMSVPSISPEDTILMALVFDNAAAAAPVNDADHITITPTHASGSFTFTGGMPDDGDTVSVNGTVYTWKDSATALNHVQIPVGDGVADLDAANALAAAINAYEGRYEARLNGNSWRTPQVVASVVNGSDPKVVITAVVNGSAGNLIALANTTAEIDVSGAHLSGGTTAGSITSTTDLTGKTMVLFWFNKGPDVSAPVEEVGSIE